MTWDPIWETVFSSSAWGRYPNEDLIRFMARNFYHSKDRSKVRVLEMGCGNGSNLWYLAKEGFNVTGVDGSQMAITLAQRRLKEEGNIAQCLVGDVSNLAAMFGPAEFDAVVDVACLQCNRYEGVRAIIRQCQRILRPGGRMFSLILSRGTWGEKTGREVEPSTYTDIPEGPLKDRGLNHFFSREEIDDLWQAFPVRKIEYVVRSYENGSRQYRSWIVDAALPR